MRLLGRQQENSAVVSLAGTRVRQNLLGLEREDEEQKSRKQKDEEQKEYNAEQILPDIVGHGQVKDVPGRFELRQTRIQRSEDFLEAMAAPRVLPALSVNRDDGGSQGYLTPLRDQQHLQGRNNPVNVPQINLEPLDLRAVPLVEKEHGSLVEVLRGHLLLLLCERDRAAAVLVPNDKAALDQSSQLIVCALVVLVQRTEAGDFLPHLVNGRELLLQRLLILGLLGFLLVDLRLRLPALRLERGVRDSGTYLDLQHARGAAVAHGDRTRALERAGQLRVHLDEQIAVPRHLPVPREDALGAPVDERLADDRGADIDDPAAWELRNLVPLGRQVQMHCLELC